MMFMIFDDFHACCLVVACFLLALGAVWSSFLVPKTEPLLKLPIEAPVRRADVGPMLVRFLVDFRTGPLECRDERSEELGGGLEDL